MRDRWLAVVGVSLVSVAVGCRDSASSEPIVCTADFRMAIVVAVRDSITGEPRATGAAGVVRDGAYTDSLRGANLTLSGAPERAGTYTVTIERPGYHTWSVGGIQVTRNACHVNTAQLTARLVPSP